MSKNSVSIAMCTYNGERFLREQLESIAAQTRLPDEVVICDDGSTDGTMEILRQWAGEVPFEVRVIQNEKNLGYAKNFEKAMALCTKDIVFLSDQDDVWLPKKIQEMLQVFEEKPKVGLVYCYAGTMDEKGNDVGFPWNDFCRAYLKDSVFRMLSVRSNDVCHSGCCGAFRSKLLFEIFPIKDNYIHDLYIYLMGQAYMERYTLTHPLLYHRLHENNATSRKGWREEYQEFLERGKTAYRWVPGYIFLWENKIEDFLEQLKAVPDSVYKRRTVRFIKNNQAHYVNRTRIERNFFIFFPLFLLEMVSGRYFFRDQPILSILHDVKTGIRNALNPAKGGTLCQWLRSKVFHLSDEHKD